MIRSTALLVTLLAACADAPTGTESPAGGGKADGDATTIVFDRAWNELADGPLEAGTIILVDYDLERLKTCRGSTAGSEVWGVTGWVQFDDARPESFAVSQLFAGRVRPVTAEVLLPRGAEVAQLWFQITNRWGCTAFDSDFGANYVFELE